MPPYQTFCTVVVEKEAYYNKTDYEMVEGITNKNCIVRLCRASTRRRLNVGLMLGQRRIRWTNNKPALSQRRMQLGEIIIFVFFHYYAIHCILAAAIVHY